MEPSPPGIAAAAMPPISNNVSRINKIASNWRPLREPPTPPPPPPGPPGLLPPGGRPPPPPAARVTIAVPIPAPATTAALFPVFPRLVGGAALDPFGCAVTAAATIGTAASSTGGTGSLPVVLGRDAAVEKVI